MLSKVAFYLGALSTDCDRCHCPLPVANPNLPPVLRTRSEFPLSSPAKNKWQIFPSRKISNLHRLITRRTDCVCQGQCWFVRGLARLRYLVKQCPISSRGEIVEITVVLWVVFWVICGYALGVCWLCFGYDEAGMFLKCFMQNSLILGWGEKSIWGKSSRDAEGFLFSARIHMKITS